MKKFAIALLAFCLTLAGCGRQQARAGFTTLMRQDVPIALNAPAAPVLAALGAPFGYGESKSGLYSGVEKTSQFTGLRLKTFQSQDGRRHADPGGHQRRRQRCPGARVSGRGIHRRRLLHRHPLPGANGRSSGARCGQSHSVYHTVIRGSGQRFPLRPGVCLLLAG